MCYEASTQHQVPLSLIRSLGICQQALSQDDVFEMSLRYLQFDTKMPADLKLSGFLTTTIPAPRTAVGTTTYLTKALQSLGMVTYRKTARLRVTKGCASRKPNTVKKDGALMLKEGRAYGNAVTRSRISVALT